MSETSDAWAVWCRVAFKELRRGMKQERQQHAIGFGEIEGTLKRTSNVTP